MRNKIEFKFFIFLLIIFMLNGCAKKEISPEIRDLMNKNGLSSEQVCKGNNIFIVNRDGKIICNDWISIEQKHIKLGLEFKKFELYCSKINGNIELGSISVRNSDYRYGSEDYISKDNVLYCYIHSKKYVFNDYELLNGSMKGNTLYRNDYEHMSKLYEEVERMEKISLERNKIESEKIAQLESVQSRLKSLGITEKDIKDKVNVQTIITHHDIDLYLKFKEEHKKEQEYEKSLKIQNGSQYICTDGYDSWILKYNGNIITFGERTFFKNFWNDNAYQRYNGDNNPIIIDRKNSTVILSGNKLTCRPR